MKPKRLVAYFDKQVSDFFSRQRLHVTIKKQ